MSEFISPMLAASMPKTPLDIRPGVWVAEEKLDGHRLIVARGEDGPIVDRFGTQEGVRLNVKAWSRYGLERALPPHVVQAISRLPRGVYDGELLVPGKRSYGVTEIANGPDLVFVVFDVLELFGVSTLAQSYDERRAYLEEMQRRRVFHAGGVTLTPTYPIASQEQVDDLFREVLRRDGEGLILKRRTAHYFPGKRPKYGWVKLKGLRTAVLTVVGFVPSKGLIQNRGPFATVVLRDDDGNETTVKTRNDAELRRFEEEAKSHGIDLHQRRADIEGTSRNEAKARNFAGLFSDDPMTEPLASEAMAVHPAIGRRLRIEYQERTPDGNYRHPRWDRWAEEGE